MSSIRAPRAPGKTSPSPSPSVCATSRTCAARAHSGTRCARCSTRNSNTSLTAGIARDACTARIADATSPWGTDRSCCTTAPLWSEHGADAVARIVGPELHRRGPLHHRADPLAHAPRSLRSDVPDGSENRQHVSARHVADRHPADAGHQVARHARLPVVGVPRIAPAGPLVIPHALGSVGERGHALGGGLPASGSPPERASLRLAKACSRASLSKTSGKPPSPISRRRPRMAIR